MCNDGKELQELYFTLSFFLHPKSGTLVRDSNFILYDQIVLTISWSRFSQTTRCFCASGGNIVCRRSVPREPAPGWHSSSIQPAVDSWSSTGSHPRSRAGEYTFTRIFDGIKGNACGLTIRRYTDYVRIYIYIRRCQYSPIIHEWIVSIRTFEAIRKSRSKVVKRNG